MQEVKKVRIEDLIVSVVDTISSMDSVQLWRLEMVLSLIEKVKVTEEDDGWFDFIGEKLNSVAQAENSEDIMDELDSLYASIATLRTARNPSLDLMVLLTKDEAFKVSQDLTGKITSFGLTRVTYDA